MPDEPIVSVDIGTSTIKVVELDPTSDTPKLLSAGVAPSPAGLFTNNVITDPASVAKVIQNLIESNGIKATKVATAVSGPCAFVKKITVGLMDLKDLDSNIGFEAGNVIPHNINDVFLDYQVVSSNGTNAMDVVVVAVKKRSCK